MGVEHTDTTATNDKPLSGWWVLVITVVFLATSAAGVYEGWKYGRKNGTVTINLPGWQTLTSAQDSDDPFTMKPAPKPAYAPPVDVVRIGPYDYKISYRTNKQMPEYYGLVSKERGTILLNSDLHEGELKETLLHEIFHACSFANNLGSADGTQTIGLKDNADPTNDTFIERVAPWLLQVMQDNPALMEWFDNRQGRMALIWKQGR